MAYKTAVIAITPAGVLRNLVIVMSKQASYTPATLCAKYRILSYRILSYGETVVRNARHSQIAIVETEAICNDRRLRDPRRITKLSTINSAHPRMKAQRSEERR